MKQLVVVAALLHVAIGGGSQVAVRLPFLNPAGVTYVGGPAPAGLAAGPAFAPAFGPAPALSYAAAPAPALSYAAAPAPALSYAAAPAPAPAYAAVPALHHAPVATVETQHGLISKVVDVAHPAVSTRRFEIRRPAIQKQFYDIEERVIVRPAGSALVELDQPSSKAQRGPAVINPVAPVALAHGPALAPALAPAFAATPAPPQFAPAPPQFAPVSVTPAPPQFAPAPPQFAPQPSPSPFPAPGPAFDDDSFVVENPDLSRSAPAPAPTPSPSPSPAPAPQNEAQARALPPPPPPQPAPAFRNVEVNGAPAAAAYAQPEAAVPSARDGQLSPLQEQDNQQRLIALLTARGGVAEVGFGRSGPAAAPPGDAGQVRARVLSAAPAPAQAPPAGERVNTRRVVVSRPIETVQEVDVVEPVTKLHRLHVQQPALLQRAAAFAHAPIAHAPYAHAPVYYR